MFCGYALDQGSYELLMEGAEANIVFTDPPYNVPIHGHASGRGRLRHREFPMASGEMTSSQFGRFLSRVIEHLDRTARPGRSITFAWIGGTDMSC